MIKHSLVKTEQFNKTLTEMQETILHTAVIKAAEYAANTDERMHNFNRLADINQSTAVKEAWHLMCKQFVSLQDMVFGELIPTTELVVEKCKDIHVYVHLIESMLHEIVESNQQMKHGNITSVEYLVETADGNKVISVLKDTVQAK